MDFTKFTDVIRGLELAQGADQDRRDQARECHEFVSLHDGQWEPFWTDLSDRYKTPRYTIDKTSPIVDTIAAEIDKADFDIKVRPAGGAATKDIAELYDGLIRNIENISDAKTIFSMSTKNAITSGIDGWRIVQKYADDDSFDQDLMIEPIHNYVDRVWLDPSSALPDGSDAKYGYVLQGIAPYEYKKRWPKGSGKSVSDGARTDSLSHQNDDITVGQFYCIKQNKRTLYEMSDGSVIDQEQYEKIGDELELERGLTVTRTRDRMKNVVYSRMFDGSGWLEPEKKTVFSYIPIIPIYGNFKLFKNKVFYHGEVEKMMDAQRIYNYSKTREAIEVALSPRAKYWMTTTQAQGHTEQLRTLNINNDPVQFYNPDPESPGAPQQSGGALINPGLQNLSLTMDTALNQVTGMYAANLGDNPGLQSGVAIAEMKASGNLGSSKYFSALECSIRHTGRILVDAIPRVYDSQRMIRIMSEDGTFDMEEINKFIYDKQTGEMVMINDLSQGTYDVVCTSGPSFSSRQQESVSGLLEAAQADPTVMAVANDIIYSNMNWPGAEQIAKRLRAQKLQAGIIPQDEWTEEEAVQIQAQMMAAQNQQPDAMMVAAQAEMAKAQDMMRQTEIDLSEKQAKLGLNAKEQARKERETDAKIAKEQAQIALAKNKEQFDQMYDLQKQQIEEMSAMIKGLKDLKEAMGVDAVVGPQNTKAYVDQVDLVRDSQEDI